MMHIGSEIFDRSFVLKVGWTLVHFLWQGAAIAALLLAAQMILRKQSANTRYLSACLALLSIAVAPLATFCYLATRQPAVALQPKPATPVVQETIITRRVGNESLAILPFSIPAPRHAQKAAIRLESAMPWIVGCWAGVVFALAIRLLFGYLRVRRIQNQGHETLDEFWQEKLARLAERLRVSRPVRLCQSALVEVPTVLGWLRPIILLPLTTATGLTPEQLGAILAHELAHIRRHDYLVNLLQNLVETLLFYHPAVWWVSRHMSQERELCCDDLAVKVCGDRIAYAQALAALEELRCGSPSLALAAGDGSLLLRIRRLLGLPSESHRSGWLLVEATALVIIAVLFVTVRGRLDAANVDNVTNRQDSQPGQASSQAEHVDKGGESAVSSSHKVEESRPFYARMFHVNADLLKDILRSTSTNIAHFDLQDVELAIDQMVSDRRTWSLPQSTRSSPSISSLPRATLAEPSRGGVFSPSTSKTAGQGAALRQFFFAAGVDLSPPKTVFFTERNGLLYVRARSQDLEVIEQMLRPLLAPRPSPSLEGESSRSNRVGFFHGYPIEAQGNNLYKAPTDTDSSSSSGSRTGQLHSSESTVVETNKPSSKAPLQVRIEVKLVEARDEPTAPGFAWFPGFPTVGILTEAQFRDALKKWEQREGVNVVSLPSVTTLSGRHARIKHLVGVKAYASVPEAAQTKVESGAPGATNTIEIGPVLDVLPIIAGDGYTIHLTITNRFQEFPEYDHPPVWAVGADKENTLPPPAPISPLPKLRLREVGTTVAVYNGQTVMLGSLISEDLQKRKDKVTMLRDVPLLGRFFRSELSLTNARTMLIFLTPTIVDPAGSPVHTPQR